MPPIEKKDAGAEKPVMLYDGHCQFCRRWIKRFEKMTGDKIRYAPCQEEIGNYPRLNEGICRHSVVLIIPPGNAATFGAGAVFKSLSLAGRCVFLRRWYEKSPAFARLSEQAYRWIAGHRHLF